MNSAPQDSAPTSSGITSTLLTAQERRTGATSRKVAFAVLAVISVLACVLALFSWYLWAVTANACVDTYILGKATPALLQARNQDQSSVEGVVSADGNQTKTDETWRQTFSKLDISSFSALIIALLFTRLAYVGCRNLVQWAQCKGNSYFDYAHHTVLFTEGFETLAIRLGLLGTLLSFLLAALVQSAQTEVSSELSSKMFLLLCASLVSTFVGTGVAYVITPSLNWLNDRAVGRYQISETDAGYVTEEFFRQVARTSERLSEFETTTKKLSQAADHISSFEINVGKASENLASLLTSLNGAIKTFDISNRNSHELAKKLERMEQQSDRLQKLLHRLPDKLSAPLESISRTSSRFKDAAQSGEVAFRELKSAAGTAHDSLQETMQRSKVTWKMLHEVRDSLAELAKGGRIQTDEVSKLAQAFDEVSASNQALVEGLNNMGQQLHVGQVGVAEVVEAARFAGRIARTGRMGPTAMTPGDHDRQTSPGNRGLGGAGGSGHRRVHDRAS